MADPGFPRQWGGRQPIIWPFFFQKLPENERNMTDGMGARTVSPLDLPMINTSLLARLGSAYSLIWGSHKIWPKGGGDTLDLL